MVPHIPILRPQDSVADYYNRKGYYSILMQAVVDCRGMFVLLILVGQERYMPQGYLQIQHAIRKPAVMICFLVGNVL